MIVTGKISQFIQRHLTDRFAVFCGAGVSLRSGVPLVGEIVKQVAQLVGLTPAQAQHFLRAQLPFEAVMEILLEATPEREILDLFAAQQPNRNHLLLAKLAAQGRIDTIATTNFDTLIEQALRTHGVEYELYDRDEEFARIAWHSRILRVIKLHGTIADPAGLAITIRAVASQKRLQNRRRAVQEIFGPSARGPILVLGYSCSDRFDITPALAAIAPSARPVLFVQHCTCRSERILVRRFSNRISEVFRSFPGREASCDTDRLVARLWKVRLGEPAPRLRRPTRGWLRALREWRRSLQDGRGASGIHVVAAQLLQSAGLYKAAIGHARAGLKAAEVVSDKAAIEKFIGDNLRDLGKYREALGYQHAALKGASEVGDEVLRARALAGIGILEEDLGNHEAAIAASIRARDLARSLGDRDLEGRCEGNAGIALKNRGREAGEKGSADLRRAVKHQERALKAAQALGDKRSEGRTLGNLGIAHSNLGDVRKAIEYYEQAAKIAADLGDRRHLGIWHFNSGEDLLAVEPTEAKAHIEKARFIFRELRLPHYVVMCDEHLKTLCN